MLHWDVTDPPGLPADTHSTHADAAPIAVECSSMIFAPAPFRPACLTVWLAAVLFSAPTVSRASDDPALPPPATGKIDFVTDIQPIFAKRCYECHGPKTHKGA